MRLSDGRTVHYEFLVACPGLKVDWSKIAGLEDTLGKNGVCSNYRADTAEYTWRLIQDFRGGNALFTQPPMPIKCAGAPQKIMYMMADRLRRRGLLGQTRLEFLLAGEALFGVPYFVPPLQKTVDQHTASTSPIGTTWSRSMGRPKPPFSPPLAMMGSRWKSPGVLT